MSGPYYTEQNWKESIDGQKKILEKNPDYEWAHNQLGWIYSFIGKTDSPFASYVENRKTHKRKFMWKIPKDTLIIWDESPVRCRAHPYSSRTY
jgi:hypothetical protein